MNVEIGAEAALFPEKEYINGIAVAVRYYLAQMRVLSVSLHCYPFPVSAKFGTCTVVIVNRTLVEAKLCTFALECMHFILKKSPIYTHDGASVKFSINLQETDYSYI
jgi:hypothetical protein